PQHCGKPAHHQRDGDEINQVETVHVTLLLPACRQYCNAQWPCCTCVYMTLILPFSSGIWCLVYTISAKQPCSWRRSAGSHGDRQVVLRCTTDGGQPSTGFPRYGVRRRLGLICHSLTEQWPLCAGDAALPGPGWCGARL